MLGPEITNMKRRPATQETVRLFNGPGNNGDEIKNGKSYNLKAGDVVKICIEKIGEISNKMA